MFRWISADPPQMVSEREKKKSDWRLLTGIVGPTAARSGEQHVLAVLGLFALPAHLAQEDLAFGAQDVHGEQHRLLVGFGPEHLVRGAQGGRGVRAVQRIGQRAVAVYLHDLDPRPRPRQSLADQRIAVGPAGSGQLEDLVELLLETAIAGGRRRAPLEPEGRHGHFPSIVHAPDDVVLGAADIGQEDLVELGRAVDLLDGAHLDAGLLHRHQEVGDAGVLGGVGVGPGQQEDVVGSARLGGPHLLAVDDPLIAVQLGLRREAGQIGSRVGFAEPLAPGDRAVEDARDELLLLFLGPPLQKGGADQRVAEEVGPQRRPGPGELLVQHDLLEEGQPLAAVFGGPAGADPPSGEEFRRPFLVEGGALGRRHREPRTAPALWQVLGEPGPDHAAELLGFGRVGQVHGATVPLAPAAPRRAVEWVRNLA